MPRHLLTPSILKQIADAGPAAYAGKDYKDYPDGDSLYARASERGVCFVYRYRLKKRQRIYTVGYWPEEISLGAARDECEEVRKRVKAGRDPVAERKATKNDNAQAAIDARENTLERWAGDWFAARDAGDVIERIKGRKKKKPETWGAKTSAEARARFDNYLAPQSFWKRDIALIESEELGAFFGDLFEEVPAVARKLLQHTIKVWNFAKLRGCGKIDNAPALVQSLIEGRERGGGLPALVTWPQLGELLREAHTVRVKHWQLPAAHLASAYLCQRASETVGLLWEWFTLDGAEPMLVIPRNQMKTKTKTRPAQHLPLAPEVVALFKSLPRTGAYVFPPLDPADSALPHLSRQALGDFYRDVLGMVGVHSPHSWRQSLATIANDAYEEVTIHRTGKRGIQKRFDKDTTEAILDHQLPDDVRRAYEKGLKRELKAEVLYWWAGEIAAHIEAEQVVQQKRAA